MSRGGRSCPAVGPVAGGRAGSSRLSVRKTTQLKGTLQVNNEARSPHLLCSLCRIEDIPPPTKKLAPELAPAVLFTGFEPAQVQQYVKVTVRPVPCAAVLARPVCLSVC